MTQAWHWRGLPGTVIVPPDKHGGMFFTPSTTEYGEETEVEHVVIVER